MFAFLSFPLSLKSIFKKDKAGVSAEDETRDAGQDRPVS